MLNKNLEEAYNNCPLLKVDIIKDELTKYLKGYILIDRENQYFTFINIRGEKLELVIEFKYINITIFNNYLAERIKITDDFVISKKSLEKRENGVILKDVSKIIANSNRFQNKNVITDIFENTYLFTRDKLENLIIYLDYKEATPMSILTSFRLLETRGNIDLKQVCNYYTEFKTMMNYYYKNPLNDTRSYKEVPFSSITYLNGEDISFIYDMVDGSDKISRIYDLYNGVITKENESDINAISLGLLRASAYDLKALCGIKDKEDSLIHETLIKIDKCYLEYIKDFLLTKYNYDGKVTLDRETIIEIITDLNSLSKTEKKFGLSYDEFEKLPYNLKQNLLTFKTSWNISNSNQEQKKENKFIKVLRKTLKRF